MNFFASVRIHAKSWRLEFELIQNKNRQRRTLVAILGGLRGGLLRRGLMFLRRLERRDFLRPLVFCDLEIVFCKTARYRPSLLIHDRYIQDHQF